jgi:putative SOS response-associated peptidase YedK
VCGRFTLRTPAASLAGWFLRASLDLNFPELRPRFNIAPSQLIACVRRASAEADAEREFEVARLQWGLVPPWSKDGKAVYSMINARAETVHEKPSFRSAFRTRRCLIVADGFYEWIREGKVKRPFYITMADEQPFCMAGIWERWAGGDQVVESVAVLTTTANSLMASIHDRMPVIIPPGEFHRWLEADIPAASKSSADSEQRAVAATAALQELLRPYPAEAMAAREVSTFVNSVRNESPDCITPLL